MAAVVHVIFATVITQNNWSGEWWNGELASLSGWFGAFGQAGLESLGLFWEGLRTLATWAVVEALTVTLVFAVPFQTLLRVSAAAGLMVFVGAAVSQYEPGRVTLLLLIVTEVITVLLVLASRSAGRQDWRPLSALFTVCATYYFFALSFTPPEHPLVSESFGVALESIGVSWAIFAKLSLGRSFGLLPADRGIVTRGAYKVVRHPVYLGYFVYHLGFLLANFGMRNFVVFTLLYGLQAMRIVREEHLLRANPEYLAYCQRVRWRFVPFVI